MPVPDTHFDDPLLFNDAFDFSRYPTFRTSNVKPSTMSDELRYRVRGRTLFTGRGSPSPRAERYRRSRNVSEPQLVSSTNYMRESWFTNFASARTVGDISNLSSDDGIFADMHSSQGPAFIPDVHSSSDNYLQKAPRTTGDDSFDVSGHIEANGYISDEDSLYSMDSADQDAHPLLLSMPIIPQIKLERKATVRKPNFAPLSRGMQNQTFLSPRIPDLRTPARMSSRRYGRILSAQTVVSDAPTTQNHRRGGFIFQALRRFGSTDWSDHVEDCTTDPVYKCSVSEPTLNNASDDEQEPFLKKVDDSPHSELLLSIIDGVGSPQAQGPHSDGIESGVETLRQEQAPHKHAKRSHQRSSVNPSISFSSIVHAVADGCASLDLFLHKPKAKPKSTPESKSLPNTYNPTPKWAPKYGQIIIKVFVPSTDDIWTFRVPQDINLVDFTSTVVTKLGFVVSFSGSIWDEPKYYFRTDERFKSWVKGRIRFGRNLPIVAHVLPPLPLVRLSVDADGCEVWCYA